MDETSDLFKSLEGPFFTDERFRNEVLRLNQERILYMDYIEPLKEHFAKAETLKGSAFSFVWRRLQSICEGNFKKYFE